MNDDTASELAALRNRLDAVEAELADHRDERAIRELLARYGYLADARQVDDYLELWTEDAVLDLSMGKTALDSEAYQAPQRWEGKAALREFMSDPTAYKKPGFYGRVMHLQGNNIQVTIDGDEALATAYSVVIHTDADGVTKILGAGANRWTFRREDAIWRIKGRVRREVSSEEFASTLLLDTDAVGAP